MKIVIVRHGEIKANVINHNKTVFYTGALNNELTELTEYGIEESKGLSKNEVIKEIEIVYASNLDRAIQTAKIAKPGFEINVDNRLTERSLGIFEGKGKEFLLSSQRYRKYILDEKYNKFRLDFKQKAPNGENYNDVIERTKSFLNSIDLNEDKTIGIFSHLSCIRCIFFNLLNITPKEDVFKIKIEHCVPYIIEGNNKDGFRLISHKLEDIIIK